MPYQHLTASEREVISQMHFAGLSAAAIGRHLGRHRGTISRELRRNGEQHDDHAPIRYSSHWAHRQSILRRQQSRRDLPRKLRPRHRRLRFFLRQVEAEEEVVARTDCRSNATGLST